MVRPSVFSREQNQADKKKQDALKNGQEQAQDPEENKRPSGNQQESALDRW
jgi:hypothetical protein